LRNHASIGPEFATVPEKASAPSWSTLADEGLESKSKAPAPRIMNRILGLAMDKDANELIKTLVDAQPELRSAFSSVEVVGAACTPATAGAALNLLRIFVGDLDDTALAAMLLEGPKDKPTKWQALLLDDSDASQELVGTLLNRKAALILKPAIDSVVLEMAVMKAVKEKKPDAAVRLIKVHALPVGDQAVTEFILESKDDKSDNLIHELIKIPECASLVALLRDGNSKIKADLLSEATFVKLASSAETASEALKLIEERGFKITDSVVAAMLEGVGVEYKVNKKKMNWQSHEDEAVKWGGHLASIHSLEEQKLVKKLSGSDQTWTGARRREPHKGNGPGPEHWEWSDGSDWDFTFWAPGEPNNSGNREDRVHMASWFGPEHKWNDINRNHGDCAGVYKKDGRLLDRIAKSSDPGHAKLLDLICAHSPSLVVPVAIAATATKSTAATALRLLEAFPDVVIDDAAMEDLLKDDHKKLHALLDAAADGNVNSLITALCEKNALVAEATTSVTALSCALAPQTALTCLRIAEAHGPDALVKMLKEIAP